MVILFTSLQSARLAHTVKHSYSHMGCHSASCDRQFPLEHRGCRSPSGRAGIPETSRLACVGVQWPAGGVRNTEMQGVRGREVILKRQERLPDHLRHKDQGTGITHPHKYPFLSLSGSWHSMLGPSPVDPCPLQRLQQHQHWASLLRTPRWETYCKKARLMLDVVSASAQQHVPSLTGHMPAEIQCGSTSPQTPWSTEGKSPTTHSNISFANFSCHIQLN